MLFLPHAMGIKRLKTIQSDIFHVNSYIFPTKHPVIIMIFGIQNQIQVAYNSFLGFLKILILPRALSKEVKNSPKWSSLCCWQLNICYWDKFRFSREVGSKYFENNDYTTSFGWKETQMNQRFLFWPIPNCQHIYNICIYIIYIYIHIYIYIYIYIIYIYIYNIYTAFIINN